MCILYINKNLKKFTVLGACISGETTLRRYSIVVLLSLTVNIGVYIDDKSLGFCCRENSIFKQPHAL